MMTFKQSFRYWLCHIFSLGLLLAATACTRVALTAVNLPTYFDATKISQNISYGSEDWQKLDIYKPSDDKPMRGVIVFLYGGRWTFGSKNDYRFVGTAFADQGYVVVIPDYSKYPAVKFPAFVQDGARALAWVSDNIQSYGGDPQRIYLMGHSAGAHIGALLTADPHYLAAEGKSRSQLIKGFIGLAGPYAFTPDAPDLIAMFGPPSRYLNMQVPTFIDGKQPPMLLLYGDADKDVGRYNLDRLVTRIHEKGGCVQQIIYPGVTHTGLVGAISWLGSDAPVVTDTTHFIESTPCVK
jgi:acetyl esterase/lipase